eukprot:6449705-Lingulodinium_polyedra.AAC.1
MAFEKSAKLRPCVLCKDMYTHFKLVESYREERGIGESAWSVKRRSGMQSSPNGLEKRRRRTRTMQRSG